MSFHDELNKIRRRAGLTESPTIRVPNSAASKRRYFERGEMACRDNITPHCLTSSPGEAGNGVYAMVPSASMRRYYTKDGEALVGITLKLDVFVIDLTEPQNMKNLLQFAKREIESTARSMQGYIKPKINRNNIQRFGRIIEDYMRKFNPNASGWIVPHRGPGVPTGKQVVLPDPNAYNVKLIKSSFQEEISEIRRRAGIPVMENKPDQTPFGHIYPNPSRAQFLALLKRNIQRHGVGETDNDESYVKGFGDYANDIFWMWDPFNATHDQMARYLKKTYGVEFDYDRAEKPVGDLLPIIVSDWSAYEPTIAFNSADQKVWTHPRIKDAFSGLPLKRDKLGDYSLRYEDLP